MSGSSRMRRSSGDHDALEAAAELVGGELMEGLAVAEPGFEQWLAGERERFRLPACQIHGRLMGTRERAGSRRRRWSRPEAADPRPAAGGVHRALMRLFAAQGRPDAALAQYERCRGELARQLGVEPDPETEALARSIRASRRLRPTGAAAGPAVGGAGPPFDRGAAVQSTSAAIPSSSISPTASPRTSSPSCRAIVRCS